MKIRLKNIYLNFRKIISRPEMAILPGQLAYFFVLSVVPIITLIGYTASFFNLPFTFIGEFIENSFSKETVELIMPILGNVKFDIKFIFLILVGFYIASDGCKSLIITSNAIYGIETNNKIKTRTKAIVMTMLIVVLFLFILIVPVFGNKIIDLIKYVKTDEAIVRNIEKIFYFLKGPFTWLVMFIFIKIIYTMAPDKKISSISVNRGTIFTTVLWTIMTFIYSYYVTHFARYDLLYAGLSNIVILMLWVYLLAVIFVIGLALNYNEDQKLEKTGIIKQI